MNFPKSAAEPAKTAAPNSAYRALILGVPSMAHLCRLARCTKVVSYLRYCGHAGRTAAIVGPAGRILDVQVREGLPATAKTDDFDIVLAAAVSHTLDDRVEAWHVAAASEDADALFLHAYPRYWSAVITTAAGSCFLKMFLLPAICWRRHFALSLSTPRPVILRTSP